MRATPPACSTPALLHSFTLCPRWPRARAQYCLAVQWPSSWLATKAYSSCGLCFPTKDEAVAWHALISQQLRLLRLRGPSSCSRSDSLAASVHSTSAQHSRVPSAEEAAGDGGGAPAAPPQSSASAPSLTGAGTGGSGAGGAGLIPAMLRRRRGLTVSAQAQGASRGRAHA
jgi:hypothetical protein